MAIVTSRVRDYSINLIDHPELVQAAKDGLASGKAVWKVDSGDTQTIVLKPEKPRKGRNYPAVMSLPDGSIQRGMWSDMGMVLHATDRDADGNTVSYSVRGERSVYVNPVKR